MKVPDALVKVCKPDATDLNLRATHVVCTCLRANALIRRRRGCCVISRSYRQTVLVPLGSSSVVSVFVVAEEAAVRLANAALGGMSGLQFRLVFVLFDSLSLSLSFSLSLCSLALAFSSPFFALRARSLSSFFGFGSFFWYYLLWLFRNEACAFSLSFSDQRVLEFRKRSCTTARPLTTVRRPFLFSFRLRFQCAFSSRVSSDFCAF